MPFCYRVIYTESCVRESNPTLRDTRNNPDAFQAGMPLTPLAALKVGDEDLEDNFYAVLLLHHRTVEWFGQESHLDKRLKGHVVFTSIRQ